MSIGIDKALDQFETDPAVALVLLEGAGERGLCAGGDIRGLYESSRRRRRPRQALLAPGIHHERAHRAISETLCRLHGRAGDGRRRRAVRARQPSRRDREDETGDAGSRPRLLSRRRRHLAVVALAGRDRYVFRAHRPDHERPRRDLCQVRRCGRCPPASSPRLRETLVSLRAGANAAEVEGRDRAVRDRRNGGPRGSAAIADRPLVRP